MRLKRSTNASVRDFWCAGNDHTAKQMMGLASGRPVHLREGHDGKRQLTIDRGSPVHEFPKLRQQVRCLPPGNLTVMHVRPDDSYWWFGAYSGSIHAHVAENRRVTDMAVGEWQTTVEPQRFRGVFEVLVGTMPSFKTSPKLAISFPLWLPFVIALGIFGVLVRC